MLKTYFLCFKDMSKNMEKEWKKKKKKKKTNWFSVGVEENLLLLS